MIDRDYIEEVSGRIQTTIGDLIEAITEIALQNGKSETEGYELARKTLEEVLKSNEAEKYLELPPLS
jgi:hypothetical protein